MRETTIVRNTAETKIALSLNLDGGETAIETGCGFLDHMLVLFSRHGRFGLTVKCDGDTYVDYHHTTEDIGIVLGQAFRETLGNMKGILRYAHILLPMDEALILAAVDISGRAHLSFDAAIPAAKVGDFDTELVKEFFLGFVRAAGITLHLRQMAGENSHHIIEGMFKAFGRIMDEATRIDEAHKDEIPSTKGLLV